MRRASSSALCAQGIIHEGLLTPIGLSVSGHGFWIPRKGLSRGLSFACLDIPSDLGGHCDLFFWLILVSPHVGRGMSIVTSWSERCASSGSMGNPSGTRYPPRSTCSSVVPHVRRLVNHRPSIPLVPNRLRSSQMARCLSPEGVNPGEFKADNSNTGKDGHVAPHHRLEPQGAISSLPLSLFWPRALLRAG